MVERRGGGETGVAGVQCLEKAAVLELIWTKRRGCKSSSTGPDPEQHAEARRRADPEKEPVVFLIDYRDGLKAAAFLMTGMVKDFTVAIDLEGARSPSRC